MAARKDIATLLRNRRVELGLTQHQVAKQLGYSSPQFISNWERGLANPPASNLKTLAKIYKMDPKELLDMLLETVQDKIRQEFKRS